MPQCYPVMAGKLLTRNVPAGSSSGVVTHRQLDPGIDRLAFAAGSCRLLTSLGDVGLGPPVTWATGGVVNFTCCDDQMLLRAEWFAVAKLVRKWWDVVNAVMPGIRSDEMMIKNAAHAAARVAATNSTSSNRTRPEAPSLRRARLAGLRVLIRVGSAQTIMLLPQRRGSSGATPSTTAKTTANAYRSSTPKHA